MDLLPLFDATQARRFAAGDMRQRARVALTARRRLARRIAALPDEISTALVQRQVDLLPLLGLERRAIGNRRLILDIDDAIWHDGRSSGGHPLAWMKGSRRKARWLAQRAEVVIAGNELLADYLTAHNDDVRVIPSLVDVPTIPHRAHADGETVVLGWIGSATTAPFLDGLRPALERAARALAPRPVELLAVGGTVDPIRGVTVTNVAWSEAAELDALRRMDIGLMPLDDTPFTRGKCAYKALQYMAAAIPVVADDVGISAKVIGDRAAGFVVGTEANWADALATLAGDARLRETFGREGRRRITEGFSYERWLPELEAVLGGT